MAISMNGIKITGKVSSRKLEIAPGYWFSTLISGTLDSFDGAAIDSSNNLYVAGRTSNTPSPLIAKYSPSGTLIWQKELTGVTSGTASSICIDGSDGIYVSGQVTTSGTVGALTFKISSTGAILWQKKFYAGTGAASKSIACTSAGTSYSAGSIQGGPIGNADGFVVGYDSSGTKVLNRQIGTASSDSINGIAVDSSGNFYVTGTSYDNGSGPTPPNLILLKFNSSGSAIWSAYISDATTADGKAVIVDTSGNVYVTGITYQTGVGYDVLLAKFNSSGVFQWAKSVGGTTSESGTSLALDSSGNIYVLGYAPNSPYIMLLLKYNSSGSIVWQRSISGAGALSGMWGNGVLIDSAGDMCISGVCGSTSDAILIKLPANGTLTGTYGNLTYAATSYTINTPTITTGTPSLTVNSTSYTPTTPTLSSTTSTLTSTTVTIA